MKILLDSHIALWWLDDVPTLSTRVREMIADPDNTVFVSIASLWEIAIKQSIGKLELRKSLEESLYVSAIEVLPISQQHTYSILHLPHIHRDPFDRMLIAQAHYEQMTLITRDKRLAEYDCEVMVV